MSDRTEEQAYTRATQAVGESLQTHPVLAELYRWGIRVQVGGDERMISAEAVAVGKPNWPTFEARIVAERWWRPADQGHYERVATRLAAELRMKWDRWQAGVG